MCKDSTKIFLLLAWVCWRTKRGWVHLSLVFAVLSDLIWIICLSWGVLRWEEEKHWIRYWPSDFGLCAGYKSVPLILRVEMQRDGWDRLRWSPHAPARGQAVGPPQINTNGVNGAYKSVWGVTRTVRCLQLCSAEQLCMKPLPHMWR